MRIKNVFIFIFFIFLPLYATQQIPDILIYKDIKLRLRTGWGHPAPLDIYFHRKKIKPTFEMWHTANYRGYIAQWEVSNDSLFLNEIHVDSKGTSRRPAFYNIKSFSSSDTVFGAVFADWFDGIIECTQYKSEESWEKLSSYYFHVSKGIVVDVQKITDKDLEKLKKTKIRDKEILIKNPIIKMMGLNENYISFYFRLHDDQIIFNGDSCMLQSNSQKLSPIFSKYNNNILDWPYYWGNLDTSGAPHCIWEIKNDKLYLNNIELHSGLHIEKPIVIKLDLLNMFPGNTSLKKIPADWVNGVYLIKHGEIKSDEGSDYEYFHPNYYTVIRIEKGLIIDKRKVDNKFDFHNIPKNSDKKLIKMIEDL